MKKSSFLPRARGSIRFAITVSLGASPLAWAQLQLKPVIITASRFADPVDSAPSGVSVISAEQIQRSGVSTVNEALMKLLGVVGRLDTSGGNNYTLDLRGFGITADSNQVVVVDGLRLNENDLTTAGLSSIPIASVERIEVLRGTGAVLYGEGATGGVVVITTKAGVGAQRANGASIYAAGGTNNLRELRSNAVVSGGGFTIDVAASSRKTDGHRVNFASDSDAVSATGQWSNDWLRLGARIGRDAMNSGLPGALSAAQYAANPRQANSLTEYGAIQKHNGGVFAEAFLGGWQVVADANRRVKRYDSVQFGSPFAYDVQAENTGLRARHEGQLVGLANSFVVGWDKASWESTIVQSAFKPVGTVATANSHAYYLKDDLTLNATGTRLGAGWRTESSRKSEASTVSSLSDRQQAWELSVNQPLAAGLSAYGRLGRSFRLANVDEFSFTTPGLPFKPQTSRDTELGARWAYAQGQVDLRWYRNNLRNEIGYDMSAVGPFSPFFPGANVNFDPTRRQGLELEARHAMSPSVNLRLNAALRQARFTSGPFAGNDVALVPRRTLALRADWRPAAGHTLNAGIQWVSSQSPDFANLCTMPGFAT
ncbi:MAG: TonB-dependent receptor, partial [Rhodoferax sp.]|nr:TonB-dependent receptor [Rhodoferax sp.]